MCFLYTVADWRIKLKKNYNDGQFVDAGYLGALQGNNIIFIMISWLALRIFYILFVRTYLRVDLSFLKEWERQHFPPGLGLRYRLADADVPLSSKILGLFYFGMKGESHLACLNTSCTLSESNVSRVARATLLLRILIIEKNITEDFLFFPFFLLSGKINVNEPRVNNVFGLSQTKFTCSSAFNCPHHRKVEFV